MNCYICGRNVAFSWEQNMVSYWQDQSQTAYQVDISTIGQHYTRNEGSAHWYFKINLHVWVYIDTDVNVQKIIFNISFNNTMSIFLLLHQ